MWPSKIHLGAREAQTRGRSEGARSLGILLRVEASEGDGTFPTQRFTLRNRVCVWSFKFGPLVQHLSEVLLNMWPHKRGLKKDRGRPLSLAKTTCKFHCSGEQMHFFLNCWAKITRWQMAFKHGFFETVRILQTWTARAPRWAGSAERFETIKHVL